MSDLTAASSTRLRTADIDPGARVGKYRLVRQLGAGGMGVVWAAHDPDLDREVALKLLRDHGDSSRVRLMREARAMAKLKHPNVLTVYEVGSVDDRDFIAMELVDGDNLESWFATSPPRADVIAALLAAGRGLAAAHAAGIVHRDFKPHNVLRARDGRVLVTDFGLARGIDDDAPISTPPPVVTRTTAPIEVVAAVGLGATLEAPSNRLTRTGTIVGTPAYMAPEQFGGALPSVRTDQFAFCITAWQGLTGARPFSGASFESLAVSTSEGAPPRDPKLSRAVFAVLARGLEPDPHERWPDIAALLAALERAAKRRRWWIPVAATGAALAIAAVAVVASRHGPGAASPCDDPATALPAGLDARAPYAAAKARWIAGVTDACAQDVAVRDTRLACLAETRDQLEVAMAGTAPDALPPDIVLGPCAAAPPPLPVDPQGRAAIRDVRIAAARMRTAPYVDADARALIERAQALAWRPLALEVELIAGFAARRGEQYAAARAAFGEAAVSANVIVDARREAIARVALAELAAIQQADPADAAELDRAYGEARAAVTRGGGDPVLGLLLDAVLGDVDLGQRHLDEAIHRLDAARDGLATHDEPARARAVAWLEIEALLARDGAGDVDRAGSLVPMPVHDDTPRVRALLRDLGLRRGDRAWMSAGTDKPWHVEVEGEPPTGAARSGRVVDAQGAPIAGARVVGWQGNLDGDAQEIDALDHAQSAIADAAGHFTLPPYDFVMAEADGVRSEPAAFGADVALVLDRARATRIAGAIPGRGLPGMLVYAERVVLQTPDGALTWSEHARVEGGNYAFEHLPPGNYTVFARASVGRDAMRVVRLEPGVTPDWSADLTYDVIVRSPRQALHVWLVIEVGAAPASSSAFDTVAQTAPDRVVAVPTPIGARDATAPGRKLYKPGDMHALLHAPGGLHVVCADDTKQFACVSLSPHTTHIEGDVATVVVDFD